MMADSANGTGHRSTPATRLHGVETEYGIAVLDADGNRLDPRRYVDMLMSELCKLVPYLPYQGANDVFTANGSRVYIDAGLHPEVASAECSTPEEAVLFTRAGDRLLTRAARAVERACLKAGIEIVLWKGNVDHRSGATWGSHESYLHEVPQSVLANQLITHLVTRLIYTGAGGFNNRSAELQFVVSPRAFHLEHTVSEHSTQARGIFHTRDEPLASGRYRRAHVLAGESVWSETADYLRIGTTALLVAQIDAGRQPQNGLDLVAPLDALKAIASDTRCHATVPVRPAVRLTAIAIQRRLLESVEADLGASHLPSWATAVCERWRLVLEQLEASPSSLIGVLDWPTKLAILKRQCETQGVEWTFSDGVDDRASTEDAGAELEKSPIEAAFACRLLETDVRFNRLDEQGIFVTLDQQAALAHRIVADDAIERAVREPPAVGRARIRAACVQRLSGQAQGVSCSWQEIVDHKRGQRLVLGDPFQCEGEQWSPLLEPRARATSRRQPNVPLARDAFTRQVPRDVLRHTRALLARTRPLSAAAYRDCVSAFSAFVPNVPVPILKPGMSAAAPVLNALFERIQSLGDDPGDDGLTNRAGTVLYRFFEARGAYARAGRVITRLLSRANQHGDRTDIAMLTNNLGYEHLLAGEWASAQPLFERAIALFEQRGSVSEVPSVQANLLECRFGQLPPAHWMELASTLVQVNRTLMARHDWRARKTLTLLARLANQRARRLPAIAWARQAVSASEGIPTQLRKRDHALLQELEAGVNAPGGVA